MRRADESSRRVPAYVAVLQALRAEALGQSPGSPLSSERELAARFGVGRMTIRAAVRALSQEGVLFVQRRTGAFVAEPRLEVAGHARRQPAAGVDAHAAARVIRFERTRADAATAAALQLKIGDPVYRVERLGLSGRSVVAHERSYVSVATCPTLFRYNVEQLSVRELLAREGLTIVSALEEVRAAAAGRTFATFSHGRASDPVLIVRRTSFAAGRRPLEWSIATYRADRCRATYEVPLGPADVDPAG